MSAITLHDADGHRNVLLEDFDTGEGIQCNQHLIVDGKSAMILDPGGNKLYTRVFAAAAKAHKGARLQVVFCSHQDPDIVASLNGWLMTTEATGYISQLWRRFIPHFGSDRLVYERVVGIPDEGMRLKLGDCELLVVPAHFLHSCGNHHVYDPVSKILYTGDLGASIGTEYRVVPDFAAHVPTMAGFHRRYMASTAALKAWVAMVRGLDIETIAPQHGALFQGKEMVGQFLDWCDGLECGIDVMGDVFRLP
ncbi:MAG: MBL fold metallo-hydrolase, partial [Myxococcota bacterium]